MAKKKPEKTMAEERIEKVSLIWNNLNEGEQAQLYPLFFEVAGAATGPLLRSNPAMEFPAELVSQAVRDILEEYGISEVNE
jgi:hypothetical protein